MSASIAEGQGRRTKPDFCHFLSIAHGSFREVETQVLIGKRLGYVGDKETSQLLDLAGEVDRLTNALSNALSRNQ